MQGDLLLIDGEARGHIGRFSEVRERWKKGRKGERQSFLVIRHWRVTDVLGLVLPVTEDRSIKFTKVSSYWFKSRSGGKA